MPPFSVFAQAGYFFFHKTLKLYKRTLLPHRHARRVSTFFLGQKASGTGSGNPE